MTNQPGFHDSCQVGGVLESQSQDLCPDLATNIAKRAEITRILSEAQIGGEYLYPIIGIPIKQPVFHKKYPQVFFVAQVTEVV